MTLAEFLGARLDEDEAAADCLGCKSSVGLGPYSPSRVKADCDAKRQIVARLTTLARLDDDDSYGSATEALTVTLRSLAWPYSDHPDYRPEWRP